MKVFSATFLSRYDSLQVKGYDYDRDFSQVFEQDLTDKSEQLQFKGWEELGRYVMKVLDNFGQWLDTETGKWIVGLFVLSFVLWICYKFHLFERLRYFFLIESERSIQFDETQIDTNIYRDDLHEKITAAKASQDYATLVHLYYLVALRNLVERNVLQWHKSYTPSEYVRHLQNRQHSSSSSMRRLTHIYLHTRFGHFAANASVVVACEEHLENIQQSSVS